MEPVCKLRLTIRSKVMSMTNKNTVRLRSSNMVCEKIVYERIVKVVPATWYMCVKADARRKNWMRAQTANIPWAKFVMCFEIVPSQLEYGEKIDVSACQGQPNRGR